MLFISIRIGLKRVRVQDTLVKDELVVLGFSDGFELFGFGDALNLVGYPVLAW